MPQLPRVESKSQLTTQRAPLNVPRSLEGEVMQEGIKTGQALMETSNKLMEAHDDIKTTVAKADFKSGMLDIQQRATMDPDYNNSAAYYDDIKKLRQSTLKGGGFFNRAKEDALAMELDLDAQVGEIQIQNTFWKKQVDFATTKAMESIDNEIKNPNENSLKNIQSILDEQVAAGFMTHETARKVMKNAKSGIAFNQFRSDLETNRYEAEKKLKENKYGFELDQMEKAWNILDKAVKRQNEVKNEMQFNNGLELGRALIEGKLDDPDLILKMIDAETIDPELGAAFQLAIFSPHWDNFANAEEAQVGMDAKMMADFIGKMDKLDPVAGSRLLKQVLEGFNASPQEMKFRDLAWMVNAIHQKQEGNPVFNYLYETTRWMGGLQFADQTATLFRQIWDQKEHPQPVAYKAAQEIWIKNNPQANQFVIGEKYEQGKYLGVNPETGKLKFDI